MTRIIVSFCLLLTIANAKAQSFEELNNSVITLYQGGHYEKAIPIAEKLLAATAQKYGPESFTYGTALYTLGELYRLTGNYPRSESFYLKAIPIYKATQGENNIYYALLLNNFAWVYTNTNRNALAKPLYIKAMQLFKTLNGESDPTYLNICVNVADLYQHEKKYDSAEILFIKVREKARGVYKVNDPVYLVIVTRLIKLYDEIDDYKKEEAIYLSHLADLKAVLGEKNLTYVYTMTDLALFYLRNDNLAAAEPIYITTERLLKESPGENTRDYAKWLVEMAEFFEAKGDNLKAKGYFLQALTLDEKNGWQETPDYAEHLYKAGVFFKDVYQLPMARDYLSLALTRRKALAGEKDSLFAEITNMIGLTYMETSSYDTAILYFSRAVSLRKELFGTNNIYYGESLQNLAIGYSDKGFFKIADSLQTQVVSIYKVAFGESGIEYAMALNQRAEIFRKQGNFIGAQKLYLQSIRIIKSSANQNNELPTLLNNLALLYQDWGGAHNVDSLYKEALILLKKLLPKKETIYAVTLGNLAEYYRMTCQYEKAKPLYEEVIVLIINRFGKNDPEYALKINNIGLLFMEMGEYDKADSCFSIALSILALKGKTPEYATLLQNLSMLKMNTGQFEKAIALMEESNDIELAIYGKRSYRFAENVSSLALLYMSIGLNEEAQKIMESAVTIMKNIPERPDHSYVGCLSRLGVLYINTGSYDKGEQVLKEAISIQEKAFGVQHTQTSLLYNNLGFLYQKSGKKDSALLYLERALVIRKRIFGENRMIVEQLVNLGFLYQSMGAMTKAEQAFLSVSRIYWTTINRDFNFLSEKEKENLLSSKVFMNDYLNSFIYNSRTPSAAMLMNNFTMQLTSKGLGLDYTRQMLRDAASSKDSLAKSIYEAWLAKKTFLAHQYALPESERQKDISSIESDAERFEKILLKNSSVNDRLRLAFVSSKAVWNKLAKDEAAIEFTRFNLCTTIYTDTVIYAAYILTKKDSIPVFVPLCNEFQLQKLFDSAGTSATSMVNSFYRGGITTSTTSARALGKGLYDLVWRPMEQYLAGVKKIDYSPAGKLFNIAFQAIPVDSTVLLMDKYELRQFSSTRQLAIMSDENNAGKPISAAFFGDASFDMDSSALVNNSMRKTTTSTITIDQRGSRGGTWGRLPGTAEEVKKLALLFDENKIQSISFLREKASEDNLKALSGNSPQILHIATHGFFLPDPEDNKNRGLNNESVYSVAEDPFLRSGLILAGGNYVWTKKRTVPGVEDGIVTAYEIGQLDLSKTDLIVLSACETALGDVKGSEGVFGLQRSFKLAGVKKMIVSLWQVPDKETSELMVDFYSYWIKGNTIEDAFGKAQTDMRKKYSPFYWAAFILVE